MLLSVRCLFFFRRPHMETPGGAMGPEAREARPGWVFRKGGGIQAARPRFSLRGTSPNLSPGLRTPNHPGDGSWELTAPPPASPGSGAFLLPENRSREVCTELLTLKAAWIPGRSETLGQRLAAPGRPCHLRESPQGVGAPGSALVCARRPGLSAAPRLSREAARRRQPDGPSSSRTPPT